MRGPSQLDLGPLMIVQLVNRNDSYGRVNVHISFPVNFPEANPAVQRQPG